MNAIANHRAPIGLPILIAITLLFITTNVLAEEEQSSWGLGVGLATGFYPHYPGSDQDETLVAPFPYPEYYGDKIQLDTDGLVANLFKSERLNLDFSLNGSLPVSDDDNPARQGMDDLELVLEIGPALEITLKEWENSEFRFDVPIRAAFEITLENIPKDVGFTFDPRFHFEHQLNEWDWDLDVGALFGTERYHQLYYEVSSIDARLDRPEYQADQGLTGWRVSAGAERRWGEWIFNAYLRYMNFSEVANEDSPLLVKEDYFAGGVALIWMYKNSSTDD